MLDKFYNNKTSNCEIKWRTIGTLVILIKGTNDSSFGWNVSVENLVWTEEIKED